jgi:hypothetical protein
MARQAALPAAKSHAVDFDATLAKYDGFKGPFVLGEPIPAMVARVKRWLQEGDEVVLFTARVCCDDQPALKMQIILLLQQWCERHLGRALEVTDRKHRRFTDFWDDRNVAIEANTGKLLCDPQTNGDDQHGA